MIQTVKTDEDFSIENFLEKQLRFCILFSVFIPDGGLLVLKLNLLILLVLVRQPRKITKDTVKLRKQEHSKIRTCRLIL